MDNQLYQVDAFTDKMFAGNPAAVMFCKQPLPEVQMQAIAAEMNLSETAFVVPQQAEYHIRYFTPLAEVPLCGHATLAAAHILYSQGMQPAGQAIVFQSPAGPLQVSLQGAWLAMNFPRYPLVPIEVPTDFEDIVGFAPIAMYSSLYGWQIAIAPSDQHVAQATPRFDHMLSRSLGPLAITARSTQYPVDFVSRCFAPTWGINEDPVTGSIHCALAPLWEQQLHKQPLTAMQLSKRSGLLRVQTLGADRVQLQGQAVTVFAAQLSV